MNLCKSCQAELLGQKAFCHGCGQKVITQRFTFKKIIGHAFSVIFNMEKGFFFTLKELILHPKKVIVGYVNGQTKKYYNPIALVFILGSVLILLSTNLGVFEGIGERAIEVGRSLGQSEEEIEESIQMMPFVTQFINVLTLMMIPFISFYVYLFYKSSDYNYAEQNIVLCYATALNLLSSIMFSFIYFAFPDHLGISVVFGMIIGYGIYAYVLKKVFEENWLISIIYASLAYILGLITVMIVVFLMGFLIGKTARLFSMCFLGIV